MLRFRGSDCTRSRGSTWYDRMDNLLMALEFIESKSHSNLCFKVEGRILMMFLLHVDDLFLTENRNSLKLQKETCCRVQDEGLVYDALLYKHGGVAESP